jgi:hypothetical protein
MTNNKAREINSPVIKQLLDETNPEELAKIDAEMSNNKQQTGVEYLVEQLFPKALSVEQHYHIEKAKEMEKQRISKAFTDGKGQNFSFYDKTGEEYYNETYGGGEQ